MADYVTLDLVNCNELQYVCLTQYEGVCDDQGSVWHWCDTQQSMFQYRHWCDTLYYYELSSHVITLCLCRVAYFILLGNLRLHPWQLGNWHSATRHWQLGTWQLRNLMS